MNHLNQPEGAFFRVLNSSDKYHPVQALWLFCQLLENLLALQAEAKRVPSRPTPAAVPGSEFLPLPPAPATTGCQHCRHTPAPALPHRELPLVPKIWAAKLKGRGMEQSLEGMRGVGTWGQLLHKGSGGRSCASRQSVLQSPSPLRKKEVMKI